MERYEGRVERGKEGEGMVWTKGGGESGRKKGRGETFRSRVWGSLPQVVTFCSIQVEGGSPDFTTRKAR